MTKQYQELANKLVEQYGPGQNEDIFILKGRDNIFIFYKGLEFANPRLNREGSFIQVATMDKKHRLEFRTKIKKDRTHEGLCLLTLEEGPDDVIWVSEEEMNLYLDREDWKPIECVRVRPL